MNVGRKKLLVGSLWCGLLLLVTAGYWSMQRSYNRLVEAQRQTQLCEKLAADIQSFQGRPGFAALGVDSPRTITSRAEHAEQKAKIPATALTRIEPQSAVRLRDSDYRIRPTRLELRGVSLEQVLAFSHAMIDEGQGTTIRDLRLTATNGSVAASSMATTGNQNVNEADSWTAELVLTQLIFSPLRR